MTDSNKVTDANKGNGERSGLDRAVNFIKKYPNLINDVPVSFPYFETLRNTSEAYSKIAHSELSDENREEFRELIEAIESLPKAKGRNKGSKPGPRKPPEIEIKNPEQDLIDSVIESLTEKGCIVDPLSEDKKILIVIDPNVKAAYREIISIVTSENGVQEPIERKGEYIIRGFFDNLVVFDSIVPGRARKIEMDITSTVHPSTVHLGPYTEKEMFSALNLLGLIPDRRDGPETLTVVINAYIQSNKAKRLVGFDTPGFYKNPENNDINIVGYQLRDITPEELHKAIITLDKVVHLFPSVSWSRVSVSIKWGLTAPFHYYMKQRHMYPKGVLLYGPSGSSKTAMLSIPHGIWGIYDGTTNNGFLIPGSASNTEARLAKAWELGTMPLILDEAEPVYLRSDTHENTPVIAMLKHGMQSTESRSTFDKGVSLALAAIGMTANRKPPAGTEALLNRLDVYESSRKEVIKVSSKEKTKFQELQNELYPQLEPIGQWVALRMLKNPDILNPDYVSLGEELLSQIYMQVGISVPDWVFLRPQVSSIEENDLDIKEQIRSYLLKSHLDDYARNSLRTDIPAVERVPLSIISGFSQLAIYKNTKGIEEVVFTTAFAKEISKIAGEAYNLQSIGDLLGFEYKVSWVNGKSNRTLVVKLEDYLKFIFPEFEEIEPKKSDEDDTGKIRETIRELKKSNIQRTSDSKTANKDYEDREQQEIPDEKNQLKRDASTDPILKLLIDCTYNSSKKFKTVTEIWRTSPDPSLEQKAVYDSLERLVKAGIVVKNGHSYAAKVVLEGRA
jgi:hypothetical protein